MEDRRLSFSTGVDAARNSFRSLQVGAGKSGYRPRSVLDTLASSGIGLGEKDRSRMLINGQLMGSRNGMSETTYEKRSLLDTPYRPLA